MGLLVIEQVSTWLLIQGGKWNLFAAIELYLAEGIGERIGEAIRA